MKHCLACNAQYSADLNACEACGAAPEVINGFVSYAPSLAYDGGGFDASYFSELARLEGGNFWFKVRNEIIIWAVKKYIPNFKSFLEIGCGTGFVLSEIARTFTGKTLNGSEIFSDGLGFASKRLPSVNLMQMDARQIPFVDEFDVVGAFDVIEHIKEDGVVLDQINKSLKPNGVVIITVPQHAWLWSATDEYAFHERRYTASDIHMKVKNAGFRVVATTSFVTVLLPAMVLSRFLRKMSDAKIDPISELKINPALNSFFEKLLKIELIGVKLGLRYPIGGSRLVVAKKI